jgi:oxygen-dependent protoporphyrinogen oxidase
VTPGRVVIVGGGLAGLACGRALARESGHVPPDVHVLEAASRAGGKALTDLESGWVLEWGPQTFVDADDGPLRALIGKLGLADEVVTPRPDARLRFVLRGGRLHAVPRGVAGLLGLAGLLRAGSEVLRGARRDAADESVHDFAARRFGERAARLLFGALVTGIYAGDARRLSLRSALPRVHALEQEHGSLIRALFTGGFVPRRSSTLRRGLGSLTDALARDLGLRLRLATPVTALRPDGTSGWIVTTASGDEPADAVVLACPAFAAAALARPFDAALADALTAIPYAPVTAVVLGYDRRAFAAGPPRGFGFLVPPGEARVLGCLFPTSTFDGMAPTGKVMLRVLVGGALDPAGAALDDEAVVRLARADVEPILRAQGEPELVRVMRHAQAIPQYELGHAERVAAIDARLAAWPGLFVTGNAYRGVSLVDVAADAARTAERVRTADRATSPGRPV